MAANDIGLKIRQAREGKKYTQQKLGELCGYVSDSAQTIVQRWEIGTRPVPRAKYKILAEVLDLKVEDLLP